MTLTNLVMLPIYIIISSVCVSVLSVQTWEEQPSSVFVNPGGEVTLACRISNKKGDCRWEQKKDNGDTQPLGFYTGKREWAGDVKNGDCSIRILDADFDYDNGRYVCQVTASGFRETDTLISREAVLSVRVPPTGVMMRRQEEATPVESVLAATTGDNIDLECVAAGGNPPPRIHWFVGSRRLEGGKELEDQEARSMVSRISLTARKADAGKNVKCVVEHSALKTEMESTSSLDIQYAPEVSLDQSEVSTIEGGTVSLNCKVDSNPASTVTWRHLNSGQIVSYDHQLMMASISRTKAGRYVCEANNIHGNKQSEEAVIDVKYGATVISVSPPSGQVDKLYNTESVEFRCHAEANPLPSYRWVLHTSSGSGSITVGHEKTLKLSKLNYEDQGEYFCEVTNDISSSRSDPILLNIHGPPRVNSDNKHLFLIEGSDASIEVEFCGSPLPKQTWKIESVDSKLSLVAGTSHDMYTVEKERKSLTNNCYISTLHILSIDQHQAKDYVLVLENEHGEEIHKAHVTVGEELSKKTLIGSLVGVAATFLLVLCLSICWCRRCCRSDKQLKQDPESRPL